MLRDNSKFSKTDYLHFTLFFASFIGYLPYCFTSWNYKLLVADNIMSDNWDTAQFHLNVVIPHIVDQALNVLQIYFYSVSLWYLIWKYKRDEASRIYKVPQFKLIRNWLFIFTLIISIITINFTVAMANIWMYDDKSIFLQKASGALLFASIVYVGMNMLVMFFPHILYGLPIEMKELFFVNNVNQVQMSKMELASEHIINIEEAVDIQMEEKKELPLLFSPEYIQQIESILADFIQKQNYLEADFKLSNISNKSRIPAHHLTYYFNTILAFSFSDWRNKFRIEHAIQLLKEGNSDHLTLEAISTKIGFSSQSTFIRAFKLQTGKTPSEFNKGLMV